MEAYKVRVAIEYGELEERTDKLEKMLDKWNKGTLDFEPTCPKYLLEKQLEAMKDYAGILQTRAKIEDVDLSEAGWESMRLIDADEVIWALMSLKALVEYREIDRVYDRAVDDCIGKIKAVVGHKRKYCPECDAKMDEPQESEVTE